VIARLLRTLVLLLRDGGSWCDGAEWSSEDERALGAFLSTAAGTKLRARLRNASLSLNAQAVQDGAPHLCGRAFGYMTAISDLQALSASGAPQDAQTSGESSDTGAGNLEHLNP